MDSLNTNDGEPFSVTLTFTVKYLQSVGVQQARVSITDVPGSRSGNILALSRQFPGGREVLCSGKNYILLKMSIITAVYYYMLLSPSGLIQVSLFPPVATGVVIITM